VRAEIEITFSRVRVVAVDAAVLEKVADRRGQVAGPQPGDECPEHDAKNE
jgi:hypothetical protein